MFGLFKSQTQSDEQARHIYAAIVEQSRRPEFYLDGGVPDTPDGRFDLILVHAFLVFHRLKDEPRDSNDIGQIVFDLMFADMDQSLREMGTGDIGVSIRIKGMAKAFYGRVAAYEAGLLTGGTELRAALQRNLYRKATPTQHQLEFFADYLSRESAAIGAVAIDEIRAGKINFGRPPEFAPEFGSSE